VTRVPRSCSRCAHGCVARPCERTSSGQGPARGAALLRALARRRVAADGWMSASRMARASVSCSREVMSSFW
jgi:hypothetical protein